MSLERFSNLNNSMISLYIWTLLFIQMLDSYLFLKIVFLMKLKPCFKPRWFLLLSAFLFHSSWLYAISVYGKVLRKSNTLCIFLCPSVIIFMQQQNHYCYWWYSFLPFTLFIMSWTTFFFFKNINRWCLFKVKCTSCRGYSQWNVFL